MFAKGELYVDELLDKEFNRIVGEVLKNKRERKGYSLQELSNKMTKKVSRQTLNKYENNLSNVRNGTFISICEALGEYPPDVFEEISLKYMRYVDSHKYDMIKK
jgi:transcriptional regulator with XRE-family HTH domain